MTSVSDGLAPWPGRAGQVRIGHLIQGSKRTKSDVWEILETAIPDQIQTNYGHWWRAVNLATGEEARIPPKLVSGRITFMVPEAELAECERTGLPPWTEAEWPANAEEIQLLIEGLGATLIAQKDHVTGEVTCPDYSAGDRHTEEWTPGVLHRDTLEHLKIAHGLDVSGLEELPPAELTIKMVDVHGQLHAPGHEPAVGGFAHRHVPEDHTQL